MSKCIPTLYANAKATLQLRSILIVDSPGSREIAEFSVNPDNLAMKGTFIDLEVINQPRSFYPFPLAGSSTQKLSRMCSS